jgi:hypothetical protein
LIKAINVATGIAAAEYNISVVKSNLERDTSRTNEEEQLKKSQDYYDLTVEYFGKDGALAINTVIELAFGLWEANRVVEAKRLLTMVADLGKRVHGPQHNTTKCAKSWLKKINKSWLKKINACRANRFLTAEWKVSDSDVVLTLCVVNPGNRILLGFPIGSE